MAARPASSSSDVPPEDRYRRSTEDNPGAQHTLRETERAVADRMADLRVDVDAMAAISNVYRAAGAVRNQLERSVLSPHGLTWTGWVVLWVIWIWGDIESRHVATEAGISKGTLTGVATTLENRGLLVRTTHPTDARRVLLSLTPAGQTLMRELFPAFNAQEASVVGNLDAAEQRELSRLLREVVLRVEETSGAAQPTPAPPAPPAGRDRS